MFPSLDSRGAFALPSQPRSHCAMSVSVPPRQASGQTWDRSLSTLHVPHPPHPEPRVAPGVRVRGTEQRARLGGVPGGDPGRCWRWCSWGRRCRISGNERRRIPSTAGSSAELGFALTCCSPWTRDAWSSTEVMAGMSGDPSHPLKVSVPSSNVGGSFPTKQFSDPSWMSYNSTQSYETAPDARRPATDWRFPRTSLEVPSIC